MVVFWGVYLLFCLSWTLHKQDGLLGGSTKFNICLFPLYYWAFDNSLTWKIVLFGLKDCASALLFKYALAGYPLSILWQKANESIWDMEEKGAHFGGREVWSDVT